jgi:dihydrolipoamide dehydrogenase
MATPLLGQFDPEFTSIMNEVMALCRFVFQTDNLQAFPVSGTGRAGLEAAMASFIEPGDRVVVDLQDGGTDEFTSDVALISTGARPRVLPDAQPDGERILTWEQVYDLEELPERLIVVGSGVTGAEFASAYNALGSDVVLVSSRDRVLPGEDADAAHVLEEVFARRGLTVLSKSRAAAVERDGDGVVVTLADGRTVHLRMELRRDGDGWCVSGAAW